MIHDQNEKFNKNIKFTQKEPNGYSGAEETINENCTREHQQKI